MIDHVNSGVKLPEDEHKLCALGIPESVHIIHSPQRKNIAQLSKMVALDKEMQTAVHSVIEIELFPGLQLKMKMCLDSEYLQKKSNF